jgi:hypothetical protein
MKEYWSDEVSLGVRPMPPLEMNLIPGRGGFPFIAPASSFCLQLCTFILALIVTATLSSSAANAQKPAPGRKASVCGNPTLACKTSATFQLYDLPFRVPKNAVIYDTELFYAIILKSVGNGEQDCEHFVPESERLAAQLLFPSNKVFTSRCPDVETLFYSNVSPQRRFMAVYAGATLVEAQRVLATVKATGKFPGANIRRMRTGFNGT